MKKHLLTAVLIVGFVGPALGADYYVALKVGGGGCVIMDHKPGPKYKNMGSFSSTTIVASGSRSASLRSLQEHTQPWLQLRPSRASVATP